jgi:hypothetical protein
MIQEDRREERERNGKKWMGPSETVELISAQVERDRLTFGTSRELVYCQSDPGVSSLS